MNLRHRGSGGSTGDILTRRRGEPEPEVLLLREPTLLSVHF